MGQLQDQQINVLRSLIIEMRVIMSGLRSSVTHNARLEAGLEIYFIQALVKQLISPR